MKRIFGLVDCNNFFASCEKIFRPDLANKPVLVLSNNDGCVISRSPEVKKLGIPMGIPKFKIEQEIKQHNITIFSSNFQLYGDISSRIMSTLIDFVPSIEQYSIDEAFLNITQLKTVQKDLTNFGLSLKKYLLKTTGIPVSIGFAPTKTLAKLANYAAKKYPKTGGIVDLMDPLRQERLMRISPLDDIWGVGKQYNSKLSKMRIKTAWDLAQAEPNIINRKFGITLLKTVKELNGECCYDFSDNPPLRKQIMDSSTLREPTNDFNKIKESICNHIVHAAENMRADDQCTSELSIFIRTSNYITNDKFYGATLSTNFSTPTSDTIILLDAAITLLKKIWKPEFPIAKTGIIFNNLCKSNCIQLNLFDDNKSNSRNDKLMNVIDKLNNKNEQIFFLGQGITRSWSASHQYKSPQYTTKWNDILKIK